MKNINTMSQVLKKMFITTKNELEYFFEQNPDFPQDLYEGLIEQIELAELSGYSWIVQESDETKPIGVIFDSFDDEDEHMNTAIYMYDDFV